MCQTIGLPRIHHDISSLANMNCMKLGFSISKSTASVELAAHAVAARLKHNFRLVCDIKRES